MRITDLNKLENIVKLTLLGVNNKKDFTSLFDFE